MRVLNHKTFRCISDLQREVNSVFILLLLNSPTVPTALEGCATLSKSQSPYGGAKRERPFFRKENEKGKESHESHQGHESESKSSNDK